jgi:hypothetical protein
MAEGSSTYPRKSSTSRDPIADQHPELAERSTGIIRAATRAAGEAVPPRRAWTAGTQIRAAALALDDDWPDVLAALRAGLKEGNGAIRARAGIAYVQLVYGRQLQQAEDEKPTHGDELDIAAMTIEEREALKRKLMSEHPDAARALGLVAS